MSEIGLHLRRLRTTPIRSLAPRLATLARQNLRLLLMAIIPAAAVAVGGAFYVYGGRYISTDNAYIGVQKVLITPDISGKVSRVYVREGQHVALGEPLFQIDPEPFKFAVQQAEARLDSVAADFANLKSNYASLRRLVDLGEKAIEIKRRMVERKHTLVAHKFGADTDIDNANVTLLTAELQLQPIYQQLAATLNQLQGDANLPMERFPAWRQAKAALDQARRDLDHTLLKAPINGVAAQVNNIQMGRFVAAGTAIFAVLDDSAPWVDANPKETDITYLRPGQKVDIKVDSFPDLNLHGVVASVGPGSGAEFAILPPQNANGNWVKVVQRVPVRINFDRGQKLPLLRAGMSVNVDIDTRRQRSLATLLGSTPSFAEEP
jgi:membrane fusion protein (multidrug efflux system)